MSNGRQSESRRSRSLFGPMILIATGVYFLLYNTGRIPELNWSAALRLWPLLLVFLGVNIIVQQAPRPYGTFLSGVISLGTIAIFGYVLFSGPENSLFTRFGISEELDYRRESISFGAPEVEEAEIQLDIDAPGATIFPLEDSNELIAGEVSVLGKLDFTHRVDGRKATVSLDDNNNSFWFVNPGAWVDLDGDNAWQIGLDPDVTIDLRVDSGAGPLTMDLAGNRLSNLEIDAGAGQIDLLLPGGDYNADIDLGAGAVEINLPADGRHFMNIDGGAGAITLYLPRGMEAQIDVDSGAGRVDMDERFQPIRGGAAESDSLWETVDYDRDDPNSLTISVDMGAGSLTVAQPAGR